MNRHRFPFLDTQNPYEWLRDNLFAAAARPAFQRSTILFIATLAQPEAAIIFIEWQRQCAKWLSFQVERVDFIEKLC